MILPPTQRPAAPFRFRPTNQDDLWNMAMMLSNGDNRRAHDMVLCYAEYGHHFDYDLGILKSQCYVLKGTPALKADAIAGICRKSGLVGIMRISSWSDNHCTYEVSRVDERVNGVDIIHEFTFTRQMADAQGLTRNRNWDTMPRQMHRVRALTMALRALFPDAVSGLYSVDEIADNMPMDDYERMMLTAESLGEEVKLDSRAPRSQPAPTPAPAPAPTPAPAPAPARPDDITFNIRQDEDSNNLVVSSFVDVNDHFPFLDQKKRDDDEVGHVTTPTPYNEFASLDDLKAACEFNRVPWDDVVALGARLGVSIEHLGAEQKRLFFYTWCIQNTLRTSNLKAGWNRNLSEARTVFRRLKQEFKSIANIENRHIGAILGHPTFWESAKVSAAFDGDALKEAQNELDKLAKSKDHAPLLPSRLSSLG